MSNSNYVAERDGVMLRVGNAVVQLYKDGGVPDGADADHVKLLVDRGLLIPLNAEVDDVDGDGPIPPKSASKADWVAYAVSQGEPEVDAEAATKDDLIAKYGSV